MKCVLHLGFESIPDFCVWVLERDGLQVPPFDQHPDGNGELRDLGMTGEQWQAWFHKFVSLLDQRLHWHVADHNTEKQRELTEFEHHASYLRTAAFLDKQHKDAVDKYLLDLEQHRQEQEASINKHLLHLEQHYQHAVSAFKAAYGSSPLLNGRTAQVSEVWEGQAEIGAKLHEWWSDYHRFAFQQRHQNAFTLDHFSALTPQLWDALAPYHHRLPALELQFVHYPYPAEQIVPPVSAVLSISIASYDQSAVISRVLGIAQSLDLLHSDKPQSSFNP